MILKIKNFFLFALILFFTAIISCEVGLGSAVDTRPPHLAVTYPENGVVIRDWFYIAGTCEDDRKVTKITAKVTNNSDESESKEFSGTISSDNSSWKIKIEKDDLKDGKYTAEISAWDEQKQESSKVSVSFIVDNHAPLLLLSKPVKRGTEKATAYGRTLKIAGDIADDNTVENPILHIKKWNSTKNQLEAEEIPQDVSNFTVMSADNPFVIAKYYTQAQIDSASETEKENIVRLKKNYMDLYGSYQEGDKGQNQLYYMGIELSDNARNYQDINNPDGTGEGNKSDYYYIQTDEFTSSILEKYNLTAVKLNNIRCGTDTEYPETVKKQILSELEKLKTPSRDLSPEFSSKFIINPENNPLYYVNGYTIGLDEHGSPINPYGNVHGYRDLTAGSSVFVLNVKAGNDNIKINPATISVKICHDDEKYSSEPPVVLLKEGEWTDESDISLSKTFAFSGDGLSAGEQVSIVLSGQDIEGNELNPENPQGYGFRTSTSNLPPAIKFNSIDEAASELETYEDRIFNFTQISGAEGKILVKGTVTSDGVTISQSGLKGEITSIVNTNNIQNELLKKLSDDGKTAIKIPLVIKEFKEIMSSVYDFTWELDISSENYEKIFGDTESNFKIKLNVTCTDEINNDGSASISIYYDNKAPSLTILSVNPVVSENEKGKTVNGKPVFSAKASDNNMLSKIYYTLTDEEGTESPATEIVVSENFEIKLDTTVLQDEKKYILNLYAEDSVKNTSKVSEKIFVDQKTDSPVLNISNGLNTINEKDYYVIKSGENFHGTISDDDGLKTVTLKYAPEKAVKDLSDEELKSYGGWTSIPLVTPEMLSSNPLSVSFNKKLDIASEGVFVSLIEISDYLNETKWSTLTNKFNLAVDNYVPVITETNIGVSGLITNADFELSGTVTDSNIAKIIVEEMNSTLDETNSYTIETFTQKPADSGTNRFQWKISFTEKSEGADVTSFKNGIHQFTITAYDLVGNKANVIRNITFDTVAPEGLEITRAKIKNEGAVPPEWFNTSILSYSVKVQDSLSGISSVEYAITKTPEEPGTDWVSLSKKTDGEGKIYWEGKITFSNQGENSYYFRAKDAAGNKLQTSQYISKIDTENPASLTVVSINDSTNALSDTQYVNLNPLKLEINATDVYSALEKDNSSGIESVKIEKIGNTVLSPAINAVLDHKNDDASENWIFNITKESFASGTVHITVQDKAGNSQIFNTFNMEKDTVPPEVTIKKIGDSENRINGSYTISGTVTENKVPLNLSVYYYSGDSLPADISECVLLKEFSTENGTDDSNHAYNLSTSDIYNWSIPDVNVETLAEVTGSETKKLTFFAIAKDKAQNESGNLSTAEKHIYTVDLDSDRPVITFQNLDLNKDSGNIWLKQVEVYGFITDDDGTPEQFKVYYSEYNPNQTVIAGNTPEVDDAAWIPAVLTTSGSTWSFTLPSTDGPYQFKFYVKDANGKEFVSRYIQEVRDDESKRMLSPKITGSKPQGGTSKSIGTAENKESIVCFRLNTTPPTMAEDDIWLSIYNSDTGIWSENYSPNQVSSLTCGGRYSKLKIKARATDKNMITGIDVSFGDKGTSWPVAEGIFQNTDGEGYSVYQTNEISCTTPSGEDGTLSITVTAKNKGQSRSQSMKLSIDNLSPELTITTPAQGQSSAGESTVTANGSTGLDIGLNLWYRVSLTNKDAPELIDTKSSTPKDVSTSWAPLNSTGTQWVLYFDGNESDPGNIHAKKLNTILAELNGKTEAWLKETAEATGENFTAYLWIKGTDNVGNTGYSESWAISVDPNGSKPGVQISYPEENSEVGGIVSVYGTATASDNKSIHSVWLQISTQYHKYKAADDPEGTDYDDPSFIYGINKLAGTEKSAETGDIKTESIVPENFVVTANDLDYLVKAGYGVYRIPVVGDLDNADFDVEDDPWTFGCGKDPSKYGIYISPKGISWNININKSQEFNFAGHTNPMIIKATAIDTKFGASSSTYSTTGFTADTPTFTNLTLVQSDSIALTDEVTASKVYADGDYVKGKWYLTGTLSVDNGQITSFTAAKSERISGTDFITDGTFDAAWEPEKTGTRLKFKILLNTATGIGNENPELYAATETGYHTTKEISVNYDNKAPVLITSGENFRISGNIQQSNNAYTFGSQVHEDSENETSQSGFERIVFYFLRRDLDSKAYIYDVMLGRKAAGNKTDVTDVTQDTIPAAGNYSYDSGIYWKNLAIHVDSSTTISLTAGADLNIRSGGLIKVGGTIYRIKNVSGATVTLENTLPDSMLSGIKLASFALCQVVDNSVVETGVGNLIYNDYGINGINTSFLNEDGDKMIESTSSIGSVTTWEASVYSANIPDGPIELHYVAFDKSGNYAIGIIGNKDYAEYQGIKADGEDDETYYVNANANILNFQPRIAGLRLKTDFTGNGEPETEIKASGTSGSYAAESYSEKYRNPDGTYVVRSLLTTLPVGTAETPFTTVKGITDLYPEIVGGSGNLYYSYNIKGSKATLSGNNANKLGTGTTDYRLDDEMKIRLQVGDLIKLGDSDATLFDITIWDSMEAATIFQNTSKANIKIYLGIGITDNIAPEVIVNPLKATDYLSEYDEESETTVKLGHIEESQNLPPLFTDGGTGVFDRDTKVSGQIRINGSSSDNKLLSSIYVSIPQMEVNLGSGGANLPSITVDEEKFYKVADYSTGSWVCADYYSSYGFKFVTDSNSIDDSGQKVIWHFDWNTNKIQGITCNDVTFKVISIDQGQPVVSEQTVKSGDYTNLSIDGKTWYSSTINYSNPHQSSVQGNKTDVIPYILGLDTILGNYNKRLQRSASGKYSVNCDEKIGVKGFNFGASPEITLTQNSDSSDHQLTFDSCDGTVIEGVDISGVNSGKISVTVNGISTINNLNNNDEAENQTPDLINTNLKDDVEISVWEFKIVGQKQTSNLQNPVLKISPATGSIGASFINLNFFNMPGITSTGGWYSQTPFNMGASGVSSGTFSFDKFGLSYGAYQFLSSGLTSQAGYFDLSVTRVRPVDASNFKTDNGYYNSVFSSRLEGISVNLLKDPTYIGKTKGDDSRFGFTKGQTNISTINGVSVTTDTGYLYYDPTEWAVNLNRIKSPEIVTYTNAATKGNDVDVYIAYADTTTNQIRFRRGNLSAYRGISDGVSAGSYNSDNVPARILFEGGNGTIKGNSLRDLFDFDKEYRLNNNFKYDFSVSQIPKLSEVANRGENYFPYVYPYKNPDHRPYSGTTQVMAADSLQTLSGQTIHVVAASGTDVSYSSGEVADIYKKSSSAHNYKYGSGETVSLGITSDKTAVIAWNDQNSNTLRLSYMTDEEITAAENATLNQKTTGITDDYVQPANPDGMDFNTSTNGKYVGFVTFTMYKPASLYPSSDYPKPASSYKKEAPAVTDAEYETYTANVNAIEDFKTDINKYQEIIDNFRPVASAYANSFDNSYLQTYYEALLTYKEFLTNGVSHTDSEKAAADATFQAAKDYYLAHTADEYNRINAAAANYYNYYVNNMYYGNSADIDWDTPGFQTSSVAKNSRGETTKLYKAREAMKWLSQNQYKISYTLYTEIERTSTSLLKIIQSAVDNRYKVTSPLGDKVDTIRSNFMNLYIVTIPDTISSITKYFEDSFLKKSSISYVNSKTGEHSIAFTNSINRTKVWENHTTKIASGGSKIKMVIDSDDGIHIAFYNDGDLMYAYKKNLSSPAEIHTIDSYDDVGDYLSLNVGKDAEGNQIPFIGYYGNKHAKYAVWNPGSTVASGKYYADGVKNDRYTNAWEITTVPTTSSIQQDNVNVAVWTNNSGFLAPIPDGITTVVKDINSKPNDYDKTGLWEGSSVDYYRNNAHTYKPGPSVRIFANGTSNPLMGYINSRGSFEVAQIK